MITSETVSNNDIIDLSSTIMRSNVAGITNGTILSTRNDITNIANGLTGAAGEIYYAYQGGYGTNALLTSLWTFSNNNSSSFNTNAITVNMNTIDIPGASGTYYYGIRIVEHIETSTNGSTFGNIRFSAFALNQ